MIKVTAEMSRKGDKNQKLNHPLAVGFHYPTPAMTDGAKTRAKKKKIISLPVIETILNK